MSGDIGPPGERPGVVEAHPWWARPGKLVWFGLTSGLGCVLTLLASLGFAIAQSLAKTLGGPVGWKLLFLEVGTALVLVLPAQLALVLFLRNNLDRGRGRYTPVSRVSGRSSRSLPISNEAFWLIAVCGLIVGLNLVLGWWALFGGIVGKMAHDSSLLFLTMYLPGFYALHVFFLLTRGTGEPSHDGEPTPDD